MEGYITLQSLNAIVTAESLIAGSCNATMSISCSINLALLMRSCWQILDLLMFYCQMLRVLLALFVM